MISTIFYLIGLFIFLLNFVILSNFSKYVYIKNFFEKFQKITGKNPESTDFSTSDFQFYNFIVITNFLTFSWCFIGLISSNWAFFVFYFLYNLSFNIFSKNINIEFLQKIIYLSRLTLTVLLIFLLVVNHFHLHLNLTEIIFDQLKR